MTGRPRAEPVLNQHRIALADRIVGETEWGRIVSSVWFAAIDDVGAWFSAGVLQHLGDDERQTLGQDQAEDAAVQFP